MLARLSRAAGPNGPWQPIALNVDEAFTQYRPQFADEQVSAGTWFYRVRARNASGISEPSNIVGPGKVTAATLVDELSDFSRTQAHGDGWKLVNRGCRVTKEDVHRAAGGAGDTLVYELPSGIESFSVFAFFPSHATPLAFSLSSDGSEFHPVAASSEDEFHGTGDYGYWLPVRYHAKHLAGGTFLKLELSGETQIGRVEISHTAPNP